MSRPSSTLDDTHRGRRGPARRYRWRSLALVVSVVVMVVPAVAFAPPASALCVGGNGSVCLPTPTVSEDVSTADKVWLPGTVAGVAGALLPQDAAQAETLQSLDQYAEGNSVATGVSQTVKVLGFVPGFSLGFKIGGYITDALGIANSNPSAPDATYVPYSNENVSSSPANWVGGQSVTYTDANGQVYVQGSGWVSGTANITVTYGTNPAGFTTTSTFTPTLSATGTVTGRYVDSSGALLGAINGYLWCSSLPISTSGTNVYSHVAFSLWVVANGSGGVSLQSISGIGYSSGSTPPSPLNASNCGNAQQVPVGLSIQGGVGGFNSTPADVGGGLPWTNQTNGSAYRSIYAEAKDIPGSPQGSSAAPSRQLRTRVTCLNASTGAKSTSDTFSAPFLETASKYPAPPQPGTCPSGSVAVATALDLVDSSSLQSVKSISSQSLSSAAQSAITSQPSCAGNATCGVTLWKKEGGAWFDCFTIGSDCNGWAVDANRSSDYICTYGPGTSESTDTALDISKCFQYGPTFDPQQRAKGVKYGDPQTDPATGTGTANDPSPSSPPQAVNQPLPVTSQPVTVNPGTGQVTQPVAVPGSQGQSCWPGGFGVFNPLNWVLQPVKCALSWAFVPSGDQLTDIETGLRSDLNSSGWGNWVSALGGVFGALQNGSGCQGPEFDFDYGPAHIHGYPLSACSGAIATAAAFSRAITTVFVIIFGGLACLRALGSAFGFDVKFGHAAAPGEVSA